MIYAVNMSECYLNHELQEDEVSIVMSKFYLIGNY